MEKQGGVKGVLLVFHAHSNKNNIKELNKLNSITLHGKLVSDAQIFLVKTSAGEIPLVTFNAQDDGLPYQKSEPLIIEVHFLKAAASHIFDYLKKDKEIVVSGFLRQKKYETLENPNQERSKYYISAEYVTLCPKYTKIEEAK